MSELIVCVFEGEDRAAQVASQMPSDLAGVVQDAAVISRGTVGSVHAELAANLVEKGKYGGIFWGMMIALIFWARWWEMSIGGAVGELGLDDDFVKDAGDALGNSSSALLLVVGSEGADSVAEYFAKAGAEVLRSEFSSHDEDRLTAVFGTQWAQLMSKRCYFWILVNLW